MRKLLALRAMQSGSGRVELVFSDGRSLKVPATIVTDLGLYKDMEIPDAALDAIREAAARASARARAVRILSATNISEKEMRRRLVQKGETEQHADDAVSWLSELHLLDDAQTARQIVRRCAARGYGRTRIRQELRQKGIPPELIEEALEALPPPDDAIDRFLAQKLRNTQPDQKELRRVTDALLRRGHKWEEIRSALARYREACEADEEDWNGI